MSPTSHMVTVLEKKSKVGIRVMIIRVNVLPLILELD